MSIDRHPALTQGALRDAYDVPAPSAPMFGFFQSESKKGAGSTVTLRAGKNPSTGASKT